VTHHLLAITAVSLLTSLKTSTSSVITLQALLQAIFIIIIIIFEWYCRSARVVLRQRQ
jgi:uncharacterized membrane protein